MEINMLEIGERIKTRRKDLGLSQTAVYEKCDITSGALSKIENGKTTPSINVFYKLSEVLDCNMEWLITGESNMKGTCRFYEKEDKELSEIERRVQMLCKANRTDLNHVAKIIDVNITEVNLAVSGIIDSPATLHKIAIFFGVDTNYLINGSSSIDKNHLSEQTLLQLYRLLDDESKDKIISYLLFIANEKNL